MSEEEPFKKVDPETCGTGYFNTRDNQKFGCLVLLTINELRELNEVLKDIDAHLEDLREGIARR